MTVIVEYAFRFPEDLKVIIHKNVKQIVCHHLILEYSFAQGFDIALYEKHNLKCQYRYVSRLVLQSSLYVG